MKWNYYPKKILNCLKSKVKEWRRRRHSLKKSAQQIVLKLYWIREEQMFFERRHTQTYGD